MRTVAAVALLGCLVSAAHAADEENPFKKSKVGDWVEYKMTGTGFEGKTKMTIVTKDDKEVTYEIAATISFMGKEMTAPVQKQTVDLTKPYDAIAAGNVAAKGVKIENVDDGKEKLKIGEKEYDTKWTKTKTTATVGDMTIVGEYKMWFSKDVPVSGLVKMETTTAGITTKVELIGSGSK
ncbi:MAG TPA: hypothetical protein VG122_25655 [Gemmata sp.]|jgi:hypothetical protein|nr:hypothetical protein [Gemmata sp.]